MKKIISSIKESVFLKLYLLFISLINFAYVFFEVLKPRYVQNNSLAGTIEKHQFEYLSNIVNLLVSIYFIIINLYKKIIKMESN